ncbi:ABC transporter permease [Schlesneria sp.]|uniref:ABC transporter permease n=1 Tax=Schlesneria sp. TaxID=2762018 RepID=UPI002F1B0C58
MKFLVLVLENIARNPVRTILTSLGTMMLVLVVTLVFTVLTTLDYVTKEKSANIKAIVTEKWQAPSLLPYSYAAGLSEGAADPNDPNAVRPQDSMSWGFFVGSTESNPAKRGYENLFFAFIMEPEKARTMLDGIDVLTDEQAAPLIAGIKRMNEIRNGVIIGPGRLEKMKKRIGDRITGYSRNYRDINLEMEIVGTFPKEATQYTDSAIINREYFEAQMDAYKLTNGNKPHPLADKTLSLVWLRVPDRVSFNKLTEQILTAPSYTNPPVKCETSSTGISSFLDAYRDIIWGVRWLLAPACMMVLALVISNAISISVRERRTEFAVLKVLGFLPWQILTLVLGEALLIGTLSGLLSAGLAYGVINGIWGGLPFPIAFFPSFAVPIDCLWWGAGMGAATAFAGSFVPAITARGVRVSDVFSKVA